jgi:superoxide reductase
MKTYTSKDELEGVLKEKHVPTIRLPAGAKANQEFEIEVLVGDKVPHPNLIEHHISWIRIFAEVDGRAFNPVQLAYVEFEPVVAEPKVKLRIRLDKPAKIVAQAFCNLHGLWESSAEIKTS